MTETAAHPEEVEQQLALLSTDVGRPGSGATRYAAAMYFYNTGMMSEEMLEIYRMCSKFDSDDPIQVATYEGISVDAEPIRHARSAIA